MMGEKFRTCKREANMRKDIRKFIPMTLGK